MEAVGIGDLIREIEERRAARGRDRKVCPQRNPRASAIGECDREMVYQITHWQMRPPAGDWLLQRFRRGHEVESLVKAELAELGFFVEGGQLSVDIRDRDRTLLCSAHIDGRLRWRGLLPVWENKSLNPNVWQRFETLDDFRDGPSWAKKYPAQLLLYMYACSEPFGLMTLDDCLGHWRLIPVRLEDHLQEVEAILRRLRVVVDAAMDEDGAERLPYHDNPVTCKACWCHQVGLCHPPVEYDGIDVIADEVLIDAAETLRRTGDDHRDYEAADRTIKAAVHARGAGQYLIGPALVKVTEVTSTAYEVPEDVKSAFKVRKTTLRKTISWPETGQC